LEFNRIKNFEVKKSLRNVVKFKNIELKITLEMVKLYFKENGTFREVIVKFMTRMQNIIINHQLKMRQNTISDFKKQSQSRNQHSWKVYLEESNERTLRSKSNTNTNEDTSIDKVQTNKSYIEEQKFELDNLEKNDQVEQIDNNKSCLSDNEVILKTKINFLKVLKDVTKNMAGQLHKEGKDLTILRDSIPKEDKLQTIIQHNITFKKEDDEDEPVVKNQDISIHIKKEETTKITNNNTEKPPTISNKDREKKQGCKCHCLIF
jgi:hypothetical protein